MSLRRCPGWTFTAALAATHRSAQCDASLRRHRLGGVSSGARGSLSRHCDLIMEQSTHTKRGLTQQRDVTVLGRTIRRNQTPPKLEPLGNFLGPKRSDIGSPLAVGYGSGYVYNSRVANRLHPATARQAVPNQGALGRAHGPIRFSCRGRACSVQDRCSHSHECAQNEASVACPQSNNGATT